MLPPGPGANPLQTLTYLRDPYRYFEDNRRRHGDLFSARFPGGSVVFIGDPALVQEIWRRDVEGAFTLRDDGFLEPVFGGRSILVTMGELHERQRRLFLPPFHGGRMRAYGQLMRDAAARAIARWAPGQRLRMHDEMVAVSLEITIAAVLGIRDPIRAALFRERLRPLFHAVGPFILFLRALRVDLGRLSPWGRFLEARRRFRALVAEEIRARRARPEEDRADILSLLLAARGEDGRPLDDDELQDHLLTLLVLGHESTASALAWGIFWIYRDRRVLAALEDELCGVPADAGCDDIARLPYLGAVCKEILRAYPIVPEVRRRVLKDPWSVRGYTLPAGTYLAPSVYLVHRHPALYPDAGAFRPERFLERRFAGHEYMPFGGGARRCTGAAFAEYEMALVLSAIAASVELTVGRASSVEVRRMNLAVGPPNGVEVTVRRVRAA